MADLSPLSQIRSLETQLRAVLSSQDPALMPNAQLKLVGELKNDLTDARLDVRDYEFSQNRVEQVLQSKQAHESIGRVRAGILAASEYDMFNAVDVAQYTAQLEQIIDQVS